MISHQPLGVGVIDVMVEAFKNNEEVNMELNESPAMRHQLLNFVIKSITEFGHVDRYLDFLSVVCSDASGETLHVETCKAVLQKLVASTKVIMPRRVRAESKQVEIDVDISTTASSAERPKSNWIPLSSLMFDHEFQLAPHLMRITKAPEGEGYHVPRPRASLQYHMATMHLFTKLCVPENQEALRSLVRGSELGRTILRGTHVLRHNSNCFL